MATTKATTTAGDHLMTDGHHHAGDGGTAFGGSVDVIIQDAPTVGKTVDTTVHVGPGTDGPAPPQHVSSGSAPPTSSHAEENHMVDTTMHPVLGDDAAGSEPTVEHPLSEHIVDEEGPTRQDHVPSEEEANTTETLDQTTSAPQTVPISASSRASEPDDVVGSGSLGVKRKFTERGTSQGPQDGDDGTVTTTGASAATSAPQEGLLKRLRDDSEADDNPRESKRPSPPPQENVPAETAETAQALKPVRTLFFVKWYPCDVNLAHASGCFVSQLYT